MILKKLKNVGLEVLQEKMKILDKIKKMFRKKTTTKKGEPNMLRPLKNKKKTLEQ